MKNSFAVLVCEKRSGKMVLFSGDLSVGLQKRDVPKKIEDEIDMFVCEMAHFKMSDIAPYLERCRAARVVFTHVNSDEKFDCIRSIVGKYPFEVIIAEDGTRIEI